MTVGNRCPLCGSKKKWDGTYCSNCAFDLSVPATVCPKCSLAYAFDGEKCRHCGWQIDTHIRAFPICPSCGRIRGWKGDHCDRCAYELDIRCPRCLWEYAWDGDKCNHCGFEAGGEYPIRGYAAQKLATLDPKSVSDIFDDVKPYLVGGIHATTILLKFLSGFDDGEA